MTLQPTGGAALAQRHTGSSSRGATSSPVRLAVADDADAKAGRHRGQAERQDEDESPAKVLCGCRRGWISDK